MVSLSRISNFCVGGSTATITGQPVHLLKLQQQQEPFVADKNGDFDMGHIYVQEFRVERRKHAIPLMLWHGGGLTGSIWEKNACGGPGWLFRALERGFDVLVSDAVGMGRSSWAHLPALHGKTPVFRSKGEAWELFRIGASEGYRDREAFDGSQFPAEHFDAFSSLIVPRWTEMDELNIEAYSNLVATVGECVIIAHSSAALYAYEALSRWPNLVHAICFIEPGFAPPWEACRAVNELLGKPILHIFGDFIHGDRHWETLRNQTLAGFNNYIDREQSLWIDLPDQGITGNSHCPMSDKNSDVVVGLILDWLESLDRRSPETDATRTKTPGQS